MNEEDYHKPSGMMLFSSVALHDAADLADVLSFTDEQERVGLGTWDHGPIRGQGRRNKEEPAFDGYCSLPAFGFSVLGAPVQLSSAALEALKVHAFGDLSCSLQVIPWHERGEGWSLVVASWNEIIGGVWLAVVQTSSVVKLWEKWEQEKQEKGQVVTGATRPRVAL